MKILLLTTIKVYWILIPKAKRKKCLFKKSCSNYVYDKTKSEGFLSGLRAFRFRINNCNPYYRLIEVNGEVLLITKSSKVFNQNELNQTLLKQE